MIGQGVPDRLWRLFLAAFGHSGARNGSEGNVGSPVLESLLDAGVRVDMHGRLIEANATYQALVGYTEKELRSLSE